MPQSFVRYRFGSPSGAHELDPTTQRLLRDGKPLKLPARALELLQLLIEHRHRVVGKGELQELMAARREVDKAELMRLVSLLRRMLGDAAIATVPGRGWRFMPMLEGDESTPLHLKLRQMAPSTSAPVDGLPRPSLRPLLGREADLAVLNALLPERRLISVVGREGVGKTQLVAHALAHRPGVAWVDLSRWKHWAAQGQENGPDAGPDAGPEGGPASASFDAANAVARAIAHTLGSRHATAEPLTDLCHALRLLEPPGLWLVLDGTTQSALPRDDVARAVQQLLAAAAPLRVILLATQPLAVPGEAVHRLQGLPLPAPGADATAARQSSAMRLLLAQARRVDRSYALELRDTPACAAAAQLVQWLEGLPMALELAGARLPALGPERLLQELVHHRAALPSEATQQRASVLRLVMDWTLKRCTDAEVALLRELASRGERAVRAEAVDASAPVPLNADALDSLIDAAVLHLEPGASGSPSSGANAEPDRYTLLAAWLHALGALHGATRA